MSVAVRAKPTRCAPIGRANPRRSSHESTKHPRCVVRRLVAVFAALAAVWAQAQAEEPTQQFAAVVASKPNAEGRFAYALRDAGGAALVRGMAASPDEAKADLQLAARAFAQFGTPLGGQLSPEEVANNDYGTHAAPVAESIMRHSYPCRGRQEITGPVVVASAIRAGRLIVAQVGVAPRMLTQRGARFRWRVRAQDGRVLANGGGARGMDCILAHLEALAALEKQVGPQP